MITEIIILRKNGVLVSCKVFRNERKAFAHYKSVIESLMTKDEFDELKDSSLYYNTDVRNMLQRRGNDLEWISVSEENFIEK